MTTRLPTLRKGRPAVDPDARKSESLPELLNRGHQLLLELDRLHQRTHNEVKSALRPEPHAWRGAKLAKGDYDKAYAELMALSKKINVVILAEHPELLRSDPAKASSFGFVETPKRGRPRDEL